MQATKRQVVTALLAGLVLVLIGVASAVSAFRAEIADEWVGFGLLSIGTLTFGGLLVRAAYLEIKDAVQV